MSIHVLDESTINKIAAGEVIERPASALKELLENSVDSGATQVEIDFERGGKKFLRVSDNGAGIAYNELPLALARHATSKIEKVEDLMSLQSFGFRGEALASLAAVSRLTLQSTKRGDKGESLASGGKIVSDGGKIDGPIPAPPIEGTIVTSEDLFFNVPARLKFLKSDGAETAMIKKTVRAFALSNHHVSVTLKQNNRVIEFYPAQDRVRRACQILDLPESQVAVVHQDGIAYKIDGVLGMPEYHLSTLQGLWFFVNGRPVFDKTMQAALMEGYRNFIMHQQYPQAVLWLWVDPTEVDVNVHPSKAQVKFRSNSSIFSYVNHAVRDALEAKLKERAAPSVAQMSSQEVLFVEEVAQPQEKQEILIREAVVQYNRRSLTEPEPVIRTPSTMRGPAVIPSEGREKNAGPDLNEIDQRPASGRWSSLHLIGQLANTYLVCQSGESLILVDQHAAHERILFERIEEQYKSGHIERQPSLFEEIIELDEEALDAFLAEPHQKLMDKMGFEYFQRGPNALAVGTRPVLLNEISLKPLFDKLGEQLAHMGSTQALQDILTNMWASMACHGAIRAGRVLSLEEMRSLLAQMDTYPLSQFCPHGRPVTADLSLYEIEKMFKRIV